MCGKRIIFYTVVFWLATLRLVGADSMAWTNNQAMRLFFEAATALKKYALDKPEAGQVATDALKAYLSAHDPYGSYLTPSEYQTWKAASAYTYFGVGMEILDRSGQLFCLPRPSSPASGAGIGQGDILVAVDGEPVRGHSIHWVGSRIRGPENTRVMLTIRRDRLEHDVYVRRQLLKDESVRLQRLQYGIAVLRISHFSRHTLAETQKCLHRLSPGTPLVLDLRNNPGGDLFGAVDVAGLFLPPGRVVLTIGTNKGKTPYRARGRMWGKGDIVIWQNRFTASAAEVLTAGLTGNRRAVNIGEPSFGKGLTQRVVALSDGSALFISRGRLYGPDGKTWQDTGLMPSEPVEGWGESAWINQTRICLK